MEVRSEPSFAELVDLSARDHEFYSRYFFPKAARQAPPPFHREIWDATEDPLKRQISCMIARDHAKTTLLRLIASKRIAFGISRTILFVGKSLDHAMRSVEWLKRAVEFNYLWASTFELRKGGSWSGHNINIVQGIEEIPIQVLAYGITGSIRGINVDDYRPDLIVLDDPLDEENTNTPELRGKIEDLIFGALLGSLAPRSDSPLATIAFLQTPLNQQDAIHICERDPTWTSFRYGCFDEAGESRWPARYTTEELQEKKRAFIARNQLSLWMREHEVKVISRETSTFLPHWVQDLETFPEGGDYIIAIDPTPPPKTVSEGVPPPSRDDCVVGVIHRGYDKEKGKFRFSLLTGWAKKSPTTAEVWTKVRQYRLQYPRATMLAVETILFARTMKESLETHMQEDRVWFTLIPIEDKRNKTNRLIDELSPIASNGMLYVAKGLDAFREQWETHPNCNHDDWLDMLAIGIMGLSGRAHYGDDEDILEGEFQRIREEEEEYPDLQQIAAGDFAP